MAKQRSEQPESLSKREFLEAAASVEATTAATPESQRSHPPEKIDL